jgi:hypothetical protein
MGGVHGVSLGEILGRFTRSAKAHLSRFAAKMGTRICGFAGEVGGAPGKMRGFFPFGSLCSLRVRMTA